MNLFLSPAPPSAGRPKPPLAHRHLKRTPVREFMEESADVKEDTTTLAMLPLQTLRISLQAAAGDQLSKVGSSSGEATPAEVDPATIRFDSFMHADSDGSLLPAGFEKACSTQTHARPKPPVPPASPSTRRPKRSATNDAAAQLVQKRIGAQADAGGCGILSESLHTSSEEFVSGSEANTEGTPTEEVKPFLQPESRQPKKCSFLSSSADTSIKYSSSEKAGATQTYTVWNEAGFCCAACTTPSSINGCWRVRSSVDVHGLQKEVATWMTRICVTNTNFVRDGEGRRCTLKVCNKVRYLGGGALHLDKRGVLHRYGKSGSHTCFVRERQTCQVHSTLLYPIDEFADQE